MTKAYVFKVGQFMFLDMLDPNMAVKNQLIWILLHNTWLIKYINWLVFVSLTDFHLSDKDFG